MSAQIIFDFLRTYGCTVTGALALLGNWECESNNESCRVQGDFTSDRSKSKAYADRIDNGLISDEEWASDGRGWGLAQWTFWSRKAGLLQFCRRRSISVANEQAQVDYAVMELKESYPSVWAALTNPDAKLYDCVELVCKKYEQPAVNNVMERFAAAEKLSTELIQDSQPSKPDVEIYWPPRMLCYGMQGADVSVLQALLLAHGYNCGGISSIFDNRTKNMVMAYQAENGLKIDGIAGPKTFRSLGVAV